MRGLGLLVYGMEGVGKTSWALQFPKPLLCLSLHETGYEDLEDVGDVPSGCVNEYITEWEKLKRTIIEADERTIVLDATSGLQTILFQHVTDVVYEGDDDKFSAYYTGPRVDAPRFMNELEEILTAKRSQGTNIILIGHMKSEETPNSMGSDYLSHVPDMDKGIRGCLTKWAQAVLFMSLDVSLDKNKKAKDQDVRLMFTEKSPGHSAKNRMKLKPVVPMGDSASEGYENFIKALPQAYRNKFTG